MRLKKEKKPKSDYIQDLITKKKYVVNVSSQTITALDTGIRSKWADFLNIFMRASSARTLTELGHPCRLCLFEYTINSKHNGIDVKEVSTFVKIMSDIPIKKRKRSMVLLHIIDNLTVLKSINELVH